MGKQIWSDSAAALTIHVPLICANEFTSAAAGAEIQQTNEQEIFFNMWPPT